MIFFIITHFHFKGNALVFVLEAVYRGEALLSAINHGEIVSIDNVLLYGLSQCLFNYI